MARLFKVHMPEDVDKPLLETLHSGYITQGPKVDQFEELFGEYVSNKRAIAVNSGTSALTLALRLAGVGIGDEVITTPMTCSATNLPILSLGATPVFADVDHVSGLINPLDVEGRITDRTKAIMAVDWGGTPADLAGLRKICDQHNIKLIEDAAHALGATYALRKVGGWADYTCFSLQAIKHITTVDGGVLTVRSDRDYERGRKLRWFGINRELGSNDSRINEDIEEWGYKFHMNDVAATIGIVQLEHIQHVVAQQKLNADYYNVVLDDFYAHANDIPGSAHWLYTILLPRPELREEFKTFMSHNNVQVSQVHRRNDEYTVFSKYVRGPLPGVTHFADRMICIPVHWGLSRAELTNIAKLCNQFAEENA